MRNIFDQYSQPENRVTHALMTALHADRRLLQRFLRDVADCVPPSPHGTLSVLVQKYPGDEEVNEDDAERRGIPDAWIHDDNDWCVIIETKVTAKLAPEQLERHHRTAVRRGFSEIIVVAITATEPPALPAATRHVQWREIYAWLRSMERLSEWATRTAEFLEIAERQAVDRKQLVEGTLTMFSGIPFDTSRPYNYFEAKRLLRLATAELRNHKLLKSSLGLVADCTGRTAITDSKSGSVWDYLSISGFRTEDKFNRSPHLTLVISRDEVCAMLTLPHALNPAYRKPLLELGLDGFRGLVTDLLKAAEPLLELSPGASPRCRALQRRYPSQRSVPFIDMKVDFDIRTAIATDGSAKHQPIWLDAAYQAFADKQGSNYELQLGVAFSVHRCPELNDPSAIDLIASAWLACKPFIDQMRAADRHPPTT